LLFNILRLAIRICSTFNKNSWSSSVVLITWHGPRWSVHYCNIYNHTIVIYTLLITLCWFKMMKPYAREAKCFEVNPLTYSLLIKQGAKGYIWHLYSIQKIWNWPMTRVSKLNVALRWLRRPLYTDESISYLVIFINPARQLLLALHLTVLSWANYRFKQHKHLKYPISCILLDPKWNA